jgi:hypothetical protein
MRKPVCPITQKGARRIKALKRNPEIPGRFSGKLRVKQEPQTP